MDRDEGDLEFARKEQHRHLIRLEAAEIGQKLRVAGVADVRQAHRLFAEGRRHDGRGCAGAHQAHRLLHIHDRAASAGGRRPGEGGRLGAVRHVVDGRSGRPGLDEDVVALLRAPPEGGFRDLGPGGRVTHGGPRQSQRHPTQVLAVSDEKRAADLEDGGLSGRLESDLGPHTERVAGRHGDSRLHSGDRPAGRQAFCTRRTESLRMLRSRRIAATGSRPAPPPCTYT